MSAVLIVLGLQVFGALGYLGQVLDLAAGVWVSLAWVLCQRGPHVSMRRGLGMLGTGLHCIGCLVPRVGVVCMSAWSQDLAAVVPMLSRDQRDGDAGNVAPRSSYLPGMLGDSRESG
jgi:hypothetical protein